MPIGAAGGVIRQPAAAQGLPPEDTGRAAAALGLTPHTLGVSITGDGLAHHAAEAGDRQGAAREAISVVSALGLPRIKQLD